MNINWTTVIASGITAAIVSMFTAISNRYMTRMLDKIEKGIAEIKEHEVWDKKIWGNGEDDEEEDEGKK